MPLIDLNGLGHFKAKENAMVADAYSASKTYAVGDYVYYNGTLYRCTTAITTAEAWTAGHWTAAKLGDDCSALKTAITQFSDDFTNYEDAVIWNKVASGGVKTSDGTIVSSGVFSYTNYIYIAPYTSITYKRIKVAASANTGIVFYDTNKEYISGVTSLPNQSNREYYTYTTSVPNNACYLRATILDDVSTYGNFEIYGENKLSKVITTIAPLFSTSNSYETGNFVQNDGVLYRFTANKTAGSWDSSKVTATTVMGEFGRALHNRATGVISSSEDLNNYTKTGIYYYTASHPSHTPTEGLGKMLVFGGTIQVVFAGASFDTANIYFRYYYSSSNTWSDWYPISKDNAVLSPSNNNTDRTAEILSMLNTYGKCSLISGDYYITNLVMPESTSIFGIGEKTRLIQTTGTNATCIRANSGCTIQNVELYGGFDGIPQSLGSSNGISFAASGYKRLSINNCYIHGFSKAGILCNGTGQGVDSSAAISNCTISNNYYGIFTENSEYHTVANCHLVKNYYGILNRGGNNKFANCGLDSNIINCQIDQDSGTNGGHGSIVGCSFNHSNNNQNDGYAIIIKTTGRMAITGCQIHYGKIKLDTTNGNIFDCCSFGQNTDIEISDGGFSMFTNCIFRESTDTNITRTNNTVTAFKNCYTRDGTVFGDVT